MKDLPLLQNLNHPETRIRIELYNHVAVRPDWHFTNRRVREHLIYYVKSGFIEALLGEQTITLAPGSLFWLGPGEPHTFRPLPHHPLPTKFNVRFELFRNRKPLALGQPCHHLPQAFDLADEVDALHDELQQNHPHRDLRLRSRLSLLYTAFAANSDTSERGGRTLNQGERQHLYRLLDNVEGAYPSPADLARALQFNADYFGRLFRRTFGMAPKHWLVEQRIHRAARHLIETQSPIGQTARRFGYADIYLFSRQFKAIMGCTASQWRKNHH